MATSLHLQNSSVSNYPYIELKNLHSDELSSEIRFSKFSSTPDSGDDIGLIKFQGYNSANTSITY